MLGLPDGVTVCLFDLDGVLTDTASVHAAAWTEMFNAYLAEVRGQRPFTDADYRDFVDGKPRADGVRDFLASRGMELPEGRDGDAPTARSVNGLGNHKNALVLDRIRTDGVRVFDGSRRYLAAAREAGLGRYVVSSSANAGDVLEVTGLAAFIQGRVDGVTVKEKHLAGKPSPDAFLAGARLARVTPAECAVFEDALAGVEAGHAGRFGAVIGVDRLGDDDHAQALRAHGATVVVRDLAQLLPGDPAAFPDGDDLADAREEGNAPANLDAAGGTSA